MAFALQTDGSVYTVAPTLGNILSMSTLRITRDDFFWPSEGVGTFFAQGGVTASTREFSLFVNGGNIVLYVGGENNTLGTWDSIVGTGTDIDGDLDFTLDIANATVTLIAGGTTLINAANILVGTERIYGFSYMGFARGDSNSASTNGGGFIAPSGARSGDEQIFIDSVLARSYVMPSSGTVIADSANGDDASVLGGTPTYVNTEEPTGDTISISEPFDANAVYQRRADGSESVGFDITYSGSPSSLSYRLLNAADSSEIVSWTVFDSSPSGGTSTLSITRQASTLEYKVEVRQDSSSTITALQANKWGVGMRVWLGGQSITAYMESKYKGSLPESVYRYDTGAGFNKSTAGKGMRALGAQLVSEFGCLVALCNTAVSGTCLTEECEIDHSIKGYWNDPTGTLYTSSITAINGMTNSDGRLEFVLWAQGGADAVEGIDKQLYKADGIEFFARLRTDVKDKSGGNSLPIVADTLGGSNTTDQDDRQAIREALVEIVEQDSLTKGLSIYPLPTYDGTHPDESGNNDLGIMAAKVYAGEISPTVSSISAAADTITLGFTQSLSSTDSVYSNVGVRVVSGGVSQAVDSFSKSGDSEAQIVTTDPISDLQDVDVFFGWGSKQNESLIEFPKNEEGIYAIPYFSYENDFQTAALPTVSVSTTATPTVGDTFTPTATASDYDSLLWTCTSGQSPTFSDATVLQPSITVNETGVHTFRLTATNTDGSAFDEFSVTVSAAASIPPTANAGADIGDVSAGATVQLDGSASFDGDGTIVSYAWAQTGTGTAVILTGASTATPSFTAPTTASAQTLTFELTVTDDDAATDTDTVDIGVLADVTTSTLTATLTNIPDGTYATRVIDTDNGAILFEGMQAWTGESTTFTFDVTAGTNVEYYAYDTDGNAGLQVGVTA
jgi:hypothetical protein